MSLNQHLIEGRLTGDVSLSATKGGYSIGSWTVAVTRNYKDRKTGKYETDFFRCTMFGKRAETVAQYFKKGDAIGVAGEEHIDRVQGQDGNERTYVEINVDNFWWPVPPKNGATAPANSSAPKTPQGAVAQANKQPDPFADKGKTVEVSEDDLPF